MSTLYIRDVDDQVVEVLKQRAAAAGTSLSSYVGGELKRLAARPANDLIVARLRELERDGGPDADEILAAIHDARR